jgi:diphosphomevalonate decarboxylase
MSAATAIAHPNIALVKYWGKRDVALNLPAVPSLSLTLSHFRTETTVSWGVSEDTVSVSGEPADPEFARRTLHFLDRLDPSRPPCSVTTHNNFPTAAGLASSSSGFAALTLAALAANGTRCSPAEASALARLGSGSACRSLWGGFVGWKLGDRADGRDCHAYPIASPKHWDVVMVVAVVSDKKKAIGSTQAMLNTARSSPLYDLFVSQAPNDVVQAKTAILQRDLNGLGRVMESSTFKMHATMHTASPPILYWQPQTVACIHAVQALRSDGLNAWLTMDAGPNVKVLCMRDDGPAVQQALERHVQTSHCLGPGPAPTVRRHD